MEYMAESDWKVFRKVHPIAAERFCARVIAEVNTLAARTDQPAHDRFLDIYQLILQRNKELAQLFDDFRRSTAFQQVALIAAAGLLTEDEISMFSPETRRVINAYAEVMA